MSWVAVAVGAGTAVVGAVSANQQAKAANKPRNGYTDQTTTQNPYWADQLGPDIGQLIDFQRGITGRGTPQVDSKGNVYYVPLPTQNNHNPSGSTAANTGAGKGRAGKGPATWTNAKGQTMTTGPGGKAVPYTGAPATGAGTPSPTGPTTPAYDNPNAILSEVARRGFDAGNTPTITGARNAMANIWGAAGKSGGSAGNGEETGFEGYNPILDRLTGTLESDVERRNGRDLLENFLGVGNGNGNGGGGYLGGTGSGGSGVGGSRGGGGSGGRYAGVVAGGDLRPGGSAVGGSVPDTMAVPSFFADQTRRMFDDPGNDADIQAMIDAMNADAARSLYADQAALDAAAQGSGRLGGDTWKGMANDARRTANESMLANAAGVRVGDRNARRQAQLAALGLVNQRDLGLLDANTSRENASMAASASAGASADAAALARRGQDLQAIGALMDDERYSLGQLGQLGGQLSGDRLSSLGMVPGLEGVGLSGLNAALGAGGQFVDMRGQDTALRQSQIGAGTQRAAMNQQLGIFNASQGQQQVNDYLRTIMGIGSMGGTSHTSGTNVQPGLGVSPTGAALQGALGGAATGMGMYYQYGGGR